MECTTFSLTLLGYLVDVVRCLHQQPHIAQQEVLNPSKWLDLNWLSQPREPYPSQLLYNPFDAEPLM